jgi:hypothetical protein
LDEQELMRLLLGRYKLKECAALLGVAYPTVCARARRPDFLSKLRELDAEAWKDVDHELHVVRGALTERLVEMSSRALDHLERLMDEEGTDDRLRAKVCIDLMDRNAETARSTKSFVKSEVAFVNPLLLKAAAQAAIEMDNHDAPNMLEAG